MTLCWDRAKGLIGQDRDVILPQALGNSGYRSHTGPFLWGRSVWTKESSSEMGPVGRLSLELMVWMKGSGTKGTEPSFPYPPLLAAPESQQRLVARAWAWRLNWAQTSLTLVSLSLNTYVS